MKKLSADETRQQMLSDKVSKLVLSIALPSTLSQLVTVVYNTADTYFVSKISTSATGAVGIVFAIMSIIQALGYGFGLGAASLISRCLGADEKDKASLYGTSALVGGTLLGLLLAVLGNAFIEPFMRILGSTDTMLSYCCDYGKYILCAAPVMCAAAVLNNVLRAQGNAVFAMVGFCSGSILNIVLDPIFIFTLNLGISGAALATALSQLVSLSVLLFPFIRGTSTVKISISNISRKFSDYLLVFRTGVPTVFRQGAAAIATSLLNIFAGGYGDAAVAAMTIVTKLYLIVRSIIIGIGQGFQPVAGYNFGAGRKDRTKKSFSFAVKIGSVAAILCALTLALFAPQIIGVFRNDADVVRIGTVALYATASVMPLMAYSTFVNQLYQCLGYAFSATFLALCRQCIFFIPLILILPNFFGLFGVQVTQAAADLCTFFISIPFQIRFYKRYLNDKHL